MKKYQQRLLVKEVTKPSAKHVLVKLALEEPLPEINAGQFVEIFVENSSSTFLRRPISVNYVDEVLKELWLLIAVVGDGTRTLATLKAGDTLDIVFPLGNGFTIDRCRTLLVGGGVGIAPLLYAGKKIKDAGGEPTFLLGARTADDLVETDLFSAIGRTLTTTEDGSEGEKGFVTDHSLWQTETFDRIAVCGPKPMMAAVAKKARQLGIRCEVSLENMMACGLGACLCCVEKTTDGNVCVCKEGPVFDIEKLYI